VVLLDAKSKSGSSSPLALVTPKNEKGSSFSDLLRGASEKKEGKGVQNGSLILALGGDVKDVKPAQVGIKSEKNLSLLKSEDKLTLLVDKEELLELNPKLASSLTKEDMRGLIAEAKNYLKEKIQNSDGYKKAEIKELPKTLGGLVEAAKKFGIDVSKISFEELKAGVKNDTNLKELHAEIPKETPAQKRVDAELLKDAVQEKRSGLEKEVRPEMSKEVRLDSFKEEIPLKKNINIEEKKINSAAVNAQRTEAEVTEEIKNGEKTTHKEIKETLLFKAQTPQQHATTEQIVQVKANSMQKTEEKTAKTKADETLKLLLREEKTSQNTLGLTADFSVATARVIAPSPVQDGVKTLEQLLAGDASSSEQSSSSAKTESLTTHKADSFEVKLNEAKQMIKYLSNDVKSAIEDYKSPFTRVKIQLNPAHLGEVDLTIVQRGKNLHVNISSNNVAVNTLAMNANELRTQLSNSGINNATLNFSDGSQSGDTNAGGGHQQRQNEQKAHEEYSYFESEEAHEEILSSLEIVAPRYI
jgi:flagellar hook-length control protein FliK